MKSLSDSRYLCAEAIVDSSAQFAYNLQCKLEEASSGSQNSASFEIPDQRVGSRL
jgi:hypothetical protein